MVIINHTRWARPRGGFDWEETGCSGASVGAAARTAGGAGCGVTHGPDLDAARPGRPGWRRGGRADHGPCPGSGAGRACGCASDGRAGGVALGCRGRMGPPKLQRRLTARVARYDDPLLVDDDGLLPPERG